MSLKGSENAALIGYLRERGIEYGTPEADTYIRATYRDSIKNAAHAQREVGELSAELRATEKQRNIAYIIAVLLSVVCIALSVHIFTASNPTSLTDKSTTQKYYVASVNSDIFHRATCTFVDNILLVNRISYASSQEATSAGKSPCAKCEP